MDVINNAIKAIWLSGFAQCGLRFDYVEGTDSSPVGYLEGIFVLEEYKRVNNLVSDIESLSTEEAAEIARKINNNQSININDINL